MTIRLVTALNGHHGRSGLWFASLAFLFVLSSCLCSAQELNWKEKSPGGLSDPPARLGHAMAYDKARGQVVLFGGTNGTGVVYGDTWVWDGSTWTQKFPQNSPPARNGHDLVYDEARGQVLLFGGTSAVSGAF